MFGEVIEILGEYFCDCCGRRLDRSEVRRFWDDSLDEIYLYCKYCGGECTDYDLDSSDDNDDEYDEYDENMVYGDEEK